MKKLVVLGLLLLLAPAGFATDYLVACNGRELKVDGQGNIWEKRGATWTQIGDQCLNLFCSRRNLFYYDHDNTLWRYNGSAYRWTSANQLRPGQALNAGTVSGEEQNLTSGNGRVALYLQANGDLAVWSLQPDRRLEASLHAADQANCTLKLQADGNLVVYAADGRAAWASQTDASADPRYAQARYKPVRLLLTDDGQAELLSSTDFKVWDLKAGKAPLN